MRNTIIAISQSLTDILCPDMFDGNILVVGSAQETLSGENIKHITHDELKTLHMSDIDHIVVEYDNKRRVLEQLINSGAVYPDTYVWIYKSPPLRDIHYLTLIKDNRKDIVYVGSGIFSGIISRIKSMQPKSSQLSLNRGYIVMLSPGCVVNEFMPVPCSVSKDNKLNFFARVVSDGKNTRRYREAAAVNATAWLGKLKNDIKETLLKFKQGK